jgi:cobaltochelatase CobS
MAVYTYTSTGRTALKSAIAASPVYKSSLATGGKNTGSMSVDELEKMAHDCGIDPSTFAKNGPANTTTYTDTDTDTEEDTMTMIEHTRAIPARHTVDQLAPLDELVNEVMAGDFRTMEDRVKVLASKAIDFGTEVLDLREKIRDLSALGAVSRAPIGEDGSLPPLSLKPISAEVAFGLGSGSGVKGEVMIGDSPFAPFVDPAYQWNPGVLSELVAHTGAKGGFGFVWLAGHAGTGKSSMAEQYAARLGRPFYRINHTRDTEALSLLGMTVPKAGGGVEWQDGVLVKALRDPGAVILLDEISIAGPGALAVYHSLLEPNGSVVLETGERVLLDPRTVVLVADNTSGHGDGSGLYHGTGSTNRALLDRFAGVVVVDWLAPDAEAAMVSARSGANLDLCAALVSFAGLTRGKADAGDLLAPLGPRRLIAWARALSAGLDVERAWFGTVVRHSPPEDAETLVQLGKAGLPNKTEMARLASGKAPKAKPAPVTDAGARAQSEFDAVDSSEAVEG